MAPAPSGGYMDSKERKALRRELDSLVKQWARYWVLPDGLQGPAIVQARERAEEIVQLLELD